MNGVQLLAQLCELASVLFGALRVIAAGTRVGFLAIHAFEAYAYLLAVGHQIAGLGSGNPHLVHFLRQLQL